MQAQTCRTEAELNLLLEAERAGGRALRDLAVLACSAELRHLLKKVAHAEGYYARELAAQVRRLGGNPSSGIGDFVEKVAAVPELGGKLELLNRGQRWVIRKIEALLPSVADAELRGFLRVMADGHRANIQAVEAALAEGKAVSSRGT